MKKFLSVALVLALSLSFVVLAGCGKKSNTKSNAKDINPYLGYDLESLVKLPDYDKYDIKVPEVTVTDNDIQAEIDKRLDAKATTKTVKKGKVEKGDTVTISFKGTLEDGSSPDGMNSDSFDLTLGEASMIDGFQEGIYGATIGKPVSLDLQFPDPYPNGPELAGKPVNFVITVLSKQEKVVPEFNEKFVEDNSDFKTIEAYKKSIAKELKEQMTTDAIEQVKLDTFAKINDETEVGELIQEEVQKEIARGDNYYKKMAESYSLDWDKFRDESLKWTQSEYEEQLKTIAEESVKTKMITFALAKKENVKISQKEYDRNLADIAKSMGYNTVEEFQEGLGISVENYTEMYGTLANLYLDKIMTVIYDRNTTK